MQYSRIISLFVVFLTFGLLTVANPIVAEKRQSASSVETAMDALQSSTNSILPQIAAANGDQTTMAPLISELVTAFDTAASSVSSTESRLTKRQLAAVADLLGGVIVDVAHTLDVLVGVDVIPTVKTLLGQVDVAVNKVLVGVNVILPGVTGLVAGLVFDVGSILTGLGFTLTGALLGLL